MRRGVSKREAIGVYRAWSRLRVVGLGGLVCVFALLIGAESRAQMIAWTFEVAEVVDLGPTEHTIRLVPAPPGTRYPRRCEEFLIHSQFVRGAGGGGVLLELYTIDAYEQAIRRLRAAKALDELARVGSLNEGFALVEGKPDCEVTSHGLAIVKGPDGIPAVYSVY